MWLLDFTDARLNLFRRLDLRRAGTMLSESMIWGAVPQGFDRITDDQGNRLIVRRDRQTFHRCLDLFEYGFLSHSFPIPGSGGSQDRGFRRWRHRAHKKLPARRTL